MEFIKDKAIKDSLMSSTWVKKNEKSDALAQENFKNNF